jgi:hypothetical protein
MKKIIFMITALLCLKISKAQTNTYDDEVQDRADSIWMNLNINKIPGGILYDKGYHVSKMYLHDGVADSAVAFSQQFLLYEVFEKTRS